MPKEPIWEKEEQSEVYPKKYESCPVCRSKRRFFEEISTDAKKYGAALDNFSMNFNVSKGACVDKRIESSLVPGTIIPTFYVKTDICLNCGCVYATFIDRKDGKVRLPTATKLPANIKLPTKFDLSGLPMNNPRSS